MDKNAIKIHILHCGTITIPANMAYIKDSALKRVTLPVSVYLVEHPVHGKILVETGLSADCNKVMPLYLVLLVAELVEKAQFKAAFELHAAIGALQCAYHKLAVTARTP